MNIIITITAVIILLTGVYFNRVENHAENLTNPNTVLSETDSSDPVKIPPSETITKTPAESSPISPTEVSSDSSITIHQDTTALGVNSDLKIFIYPNASIISQTSENIALRSQDNVQTITDWYKNSIVSQDMNVTSFVTTSANDSILNKLAGAGNSGSISVEISQPDSNSEVTIHLSR